MKERANLKRTAIALSCAGVAAVGAVAIPDYYERLGVPDYDQRWDDLPNNGDYYCLPTSFYNGIHYMRGHGVPEMPDLTSLPVWQRILTLGTLFGTNPNSGTSGGLAHNYMGAWLSQSSDPVVFTYRYGPSWSWGTYRIRQAVASGSVVMLGYGRYERFSTNSTTWRRDSGHAVTLKGYDFNAATNYLIVRDPARDDGNNQSQGGYADFKPSVKNITFVPDALGLPITLAEYEIQNNVLKHRAVDSMYQYMPAVGGWSNSAVIVNSTAERLAPPSTKNIVVALPFQFTPEPGEPAIPSRFEIEPREELQDWVLDLGKLSVVYVTKLGRVFEVDLMGDRHHKLLHVVKGAKQLMIGGRSMDLYVLAGDGSVRAGDGSVREGDGSVRIVRLERDDNSLQEIALPFEGVAMEYDPITGGPAVLARSLDRMVSFDEALANPAVAPLPDMPAGSGAPIFRINPETGWVLTGREGGSGFQQNTRGGRAFFLDLPGVTDLRSVVPVRANLMIVQDGSRLKTFDGQGSRSRSQFDGIVDVEGAFKMNRSHDASLPNFDAGWRDVPPSQAGD